MKVMKILKDKWYIISGVWASFGQSARIGGWKPVPWNQAGSQKKHKECPVRLLICLFDFFEFLMQSLSFLIEFQRWMQRLSFLWPTNSSCTEVARSWRRWLMWQGWKPWRPSWRGFRYWDKYKHNLCAFSTAHRCGYEKMPDACRDQQGNLQEREESLQVFFQRFLWYIVYINFLRWV